MCELASTGNKPELSGLYLKVKIITRSLNGWPCWSGVGRVIQAEGAGCFDQFALHLRVGFAPGKRSPRDEIDYVLIVEQDKWARLTV
jgi:hypothetical protein